jgi:hypothetical protein
MAHFRKIALYAASATVVLAVLAPAANAASSDKSGFRKVKFEVAMTAKNSDTTVQGRTGSRTQQCPLRYR